MDADRTSLLVGVSEIEDQRLDVAVEDDPAIFAGLVDDRAAAVAADDVGGADEVEGGIHVERLGRVEPGWGQLEGRLRAMVVSVFESAADGGPGWNVFTLLLVAFDLAERQTEREGGVGVGIGAANGEG